MLYGKYCAEVSSRFVVKDHEASEENIKKEGAEHGTSQGNRREQQALGAIILY